MFHLVLQRILHKKWMVASLLIGNILLIAIAVSHPMYQDATRRRMLTDLFSKYLEDNNTYPMTVRATGLVRKNGGRSDAIRIREYCDTIPDMFGISASADIMYRKLVQSSASSLNVHKGLQDDQDFSIGAIKGLEGHVNMLSGSLMSGEITSDGFIEAIISQGAMVKLEDAGIYAGKKDGNQ